MRFFLILILIVGASTNQVAAHSGGIPPIPIKSLGALSTDLTGNEARIGLLTGNLRTNLGIHASHPLQVQHFQFEVDTVEQRIRPLRLALIGGTAAVGAFVVMDVQRRRWWDERNPTFRIMNDWEYVLWADKFGHFFSTSFFSRVYKTSFVWSGMSEEKAQLWGAVAGWTQLLYYEILDGFGPQWGFSPGDALFNTLGAGYTYAQWRIPYLQAFDLKVSYWPSGWEGKNFTDDYMGQRWWVTANLHHALPGKVGDFFPPWINLAIGYSAQDLDEREYLTTPYVYVGLDLELRGLPIDHPVWNAVVGSLRYLHLPAPAIRLTPNPRFLLFAY